jgi:outer membrane biosynthesis protein TonB
LKKSEESFADRFFGKITEWLADAGNGIGDMFAKTFRAQDKLCINETCVTEAQLIELLDDSGMSSSSPAPSVPEENTASEEPAVSDTIPPETTEETPALDTTEDTETTPTAEEIAPEELTEPAPETTTEPIPEITPEPEPVPAQ